MLDALREAVSGGFQVDLRYARPGEVPTERRVHPLGLVAKRGVWYLMATGQSGLRTYRLSRVEAVGVTSEPSQRPPGFELPSAWAAAREAMSTRRPPACLAVEILVDPRTWGRVDASVGAWWPLERLGTGGRGHIRAGLRMVDAEHAARELVAFGEEVEVVGPEEVRDELRRIGARLMERYAGRP